MDPITASIVNALMAGALSGISEIGKTALGDAYMRLKGLLYRKFGARSGVMQAVDQLEAKPESPRRQGILQGELAAVHAPYDAEVSAAAGYLQTVVQQQQQQRLALRGSPVYGSIHQNQVWGNQYQVAGNQNRVAGNQYQVAGNQYNMQGELIGPKTRSGAKRVISILLIIFGLLISIPAAGMLPFFDTLVNLMQSGPSMPGDPSATGIANSFSTSMHVIIFVSIGLGIAMVIGGILLGRNSKNS